MLLEFLPVKLPVVGFHSLGKALNIVWKNLDFLFFDTLRAMGKLPSANLVFLKTVFTVAISLRLICTTYCPIKIYYMIIKTN